MSISLSDIDVESLYEAQKKIGFPAANYCLQIMAEYKREQLEREEGQMFAMIAEKWAKLGMNNVPPFGNEERLKFLHGQSVLVAGIHYRLEHPLLTDEQYEKSLDMWHTSRAIKND